MTHTKVEVAKYSTPDSSREVTRLTLKLAFLKCIVYSERREKYELVVILIFKSRGD